MPTRYVNTASTPGGDGTTNATTGVNRAYRNLSEAEAAVPSNITGYDEPWTIICEGDAGDFNPVLISGITQSADRYLLITASAAAANGRHAGKFDGSKYTLQPSSTTAYQHLLTIVSSFTRVDGIQIDGATGMSATGLGINSVSSGKDVQISNLIILRVNGWGITTYDIYGTVKFRNIVIHNCTGGIELRNSYAYNCTVAPNQTTGFRTRAYANVCKNCIGPKYDIISGTLTCYNCASADGTADDFGGSGNRVDQTFSFVNPAVYDYHLQGTDAGAKGFGVDLRNDAVYPFSDDIDGETRGSTWDIGADQITASGCPVHFMQLARMRA